MPLSGPSGIEDRSATTYNAVFTFDVPVTAGSVTVMNGTATTGTAAFSGNEMSVPLTNVANAQVVTLHVANVNNSGQTAGDINFGYLPGDTTADGSRRITADISQTKSQSGNPVSEDNFRQDVNADGFLNSADISLVKSKSGTALP